MQEMHLAARSSCVRSRVRLSSCRSGYVTRCRISARPALTPPAFPRQVTYGSATLSHLDIDSPFELEDRTIDAYRCNGFVKVPKVFDEPTLTHYGSDMSLEVAEADKSPLQKDPDYQQAFTQVRTVQPDAAWK